MFIRTNHAGLWTKVAWFPSTLFLLEPELFKAGFDIKFLLGVVKIAMNFPYFRFLELRNEFYGIDLPHVGYFL